MVLLWSVACAPKVEFNLVPDGLEFGVVDFAGEMPADGYAFDEVVLQNDGKATIVLTLPAYDTLRLCLKGFDVDREYPIELGEVAPGASYLLGIGLCSYVDGEVDTDVETRVDVRTDGAPDVLSIPVTFTPIRSVAP